MPDDTPTRRLAVLIDADNTSARIVDGLFEEVAKIGEASVRRIYGDFSSTRSRGWAEVLARHAIIPQQQFAYTTGKNASDITLVIDAMDLLHGERMDGFCLVSSDSDFTRLAARIREHGIDVYGFGEQKTPESFRQACRRFIYTENLLPETSRRDSAEKTGGAARQQPAEAKELVQKAMELLGSDEGWVNLGHVGNKLLDLAPDFDPRNYGCQKLRDLVQETGAFEIDHPEGGHVRIRAKPVRRRRPAKKKAA